MSDRPFPALDDRGVSTTVGYVLTLSIAALLISGLLLATGSFVEDQRRRTVHSELEVIGQQLATDIEAVDRLARSGGTVSTARIRRDVPGRVTGLPYTVEIDPGSPNVLVLRTENPDVTVRVTVATDVPMASGSIDSDEVVVRAVGLPLAIDEDDEADSDPGDGDETDNDGDGAVDEDDEADSDDTDGNDDDDDVAADGTVTLEVVDA